MKCMICGSPLENGALFCKVCGSRVSTQPKAGYTTPDVGQYKAANSSNATVVLPPQGSAAGNASDAAATVVIPPQQQSAYASNTAASTVPSGAAGAAAGAFRADATASAAGAVPTGAAAAMGRSYQDQASPTAPARSQPVQGQAQAMPQRQGQTQAMPQRQGQTPSATDMRQPLDSKEAKQQQKEAKKVDKAMRKQEREMQRQANERVREAKAALREARQAAGKSNAPKIIGIIVALVLAAAAGAAGMWFFGKPLMTAPAEQQQTQPAVEAGAATTNQQAGQAQNGQGAQDASAQGTQDAQGTQSDGTGTATASTDSNATANAQGAESPNGSATGGTAGAVDEASVIAKGYLGTWTGNMIATANQHFGKTNVCYGARKNPMTLEITEFEPTGRVSANATVLVHAHDMGELDRDVDTHDGDQVVQLKNLIGTYKNGAVEFKGDTSTGITVTIALETDDSQGEARHLIVTVDANEASDTYSLTRESQAA